jgi:hypothetical protein
MVLGDWNENENEKNKFPDFSLLNSFLFAVPTFTSAIIDQHANIFLLHHRSIIFKSIFSSVLFQLRSRDEAKNSSHTNSARFSGPCHDEQRGQKSRDNFRRNRINAR